MCGRQLEEQGWVATLDGRRKGSGATPKLSAADMEELCKIVGADCTLYLDELRYELRRKTGKLVSLSTMSRACAKLDMTHKIVVHQHASRKASERSLFRTVMAQVDFRDLVWFDETGSSLRHHGRKRGRAIKGMRAFCPYPKMLADRYSLAACMDFKGPGPCQIWRGSVNRERFLEYMETEVLPWMRPHYKTNGDVTNNPRSVLCMDNCSTHK